ncbi:hypothetical protein [Phenylobacterium sp.]|jgi:hypothetical protein|uniref:hypothetical protein n=1 Tax=Phenylobacterium sp. TaxID=1871053 RepID=UPI0035AF43CC
MTAFPMRRPYGAMRERAERTARRWSGAQAPIHRRKTVRLWLPLTALLLVLSPFAMLLALLAFVPAAIFGMNSFVVALRLGGVLMAIGGTLVEVQAADADVRIKIV